jgi:acyl-CoA hydrolase
MIKFRERRYDEVDITTDVLSHLKDDGQTVKTIKESDADSVSKTNSKSLVLYKAFLNLDNMYEIQVMDKELYRFTIKLLEDKLGLTIRHIDTEKRLICAVDKYKGKILNSIDILGRRYNLSVVVR